jgi:sialic acid synthase SpsE
VSLLKNVELPYVIAEIGINHGGSYDTAKRLADAAKEAGADAVKTQLFDAEYLLSAESYQHDMLKGLALADMDMVALSKYVRSLDMDFILTPFSPNDINKMDDIGVDAIKIASTDCVNERGNDIYSMATFRKGTSDVGN